MKKSLLGLVVGYFLVAQIQAETLYVDVDSSNPTSPYNSWATAATNIQDAVDASVAGDTVRVTNGVYKVGGHPVYGSMTNRVVIDKAITVQSVNGPDDTLIEGQGPNGDSAVRCVYLAADAQLSGFTLTNGHTRIEGDYYKEKSGGGVWSATSSIVTNCIIAGNLAASRGGGVMYAILKNCEIRNNRALSGGGMFQGTANNCIFVGNSADYNGGGSELTDLHNCSVSGNSAGRTGGGIYRGNLINCIVTGNRAASGGGINGYNSDSIIKNSIIWGNHATVQGDNWHEFVSFSYSCTTPLPPGTGNIESDPFLASATHLSTNSPCIGIGEASTTIGMDIDEESWLNPPSMGCDEVYAGSITGPLAPSISATFTNITVGFTVYLLGEVSGHASGNTWDFGDGTSATNKQSMAYSWSSAGVYNVIFTVFNETYPAGVSGSIAITVHDQPTHHVDLNSVTPVSPYNSWATAATNIQDAIDSATLPGALVFVTNGLYNTGSRIVEDSMMNRIVVSDRITVKSVNGPDFTIIEGAGPLGDNAVRCVYLGAESFLSGFTLTNGHTRLATDLYTEESGGGVWCESSATVSNCLIIGNLATSYGAGALYGTLNDCTLSNNSGNRGSGASFATLNDCILKENYASGWGGATYRGTLNRCILQDNAAGDDAGGAYDGVLNNCVLSGNSAVSAGGGAYNSLLIHCTVTGNSAADGGGVYANGSGMDEVAENCIIWGNTATKSDSNWGYLCQLTYSCTTPAHPGISNIEDDPLLASASHLSTNSPCIGAGLASVTAGLDIDGESWLNPPSIGCDEVYVGAITGTLTPEIIAIFTNVAVGFNVDFSGVIAGHANQNIWDFDDGSSATNQLFVSHSWASAGTYDLTFTAYNETHPSGVATTLTITVQDQPVHYVDLSSITPVAPYDSWATAATNIQDAIDSTLLPGALVLVSNGIYNVGSTVVSDGLMNRVAVTNPIVVRSVVGPDVTIIEGLGPLGDKAIRCVYLGDNATLSGFTLTNGYTRLLGDWDVGRAGGGIWSEGSGVVTNCIITGNSAQGYGGGVLGGTFYDCTILSNSTGEYGDGGGVAYATLNHCMLAKNVGDTGGAAYNCTLNNCTLDSNTAETGGGAYGGILSGCIITNNVAEDGGGVFESALTDCLVVGNSAEYGGGIDEGMLSHCTIANNSATNDGGGAMYGTLNYCTITDNVAEGWGGGMIYGNYTYCTVTGNSAYLGGGVMYGTLNGCILAGNTAVGNGGGADDCELSNCTLVDNAAAFGGGVSDSTITNCIVWHNTLPEILDSTAGHSCSPALADGNDGNITNSPLFVEWEFGNYRLLAGSPCIDVGNNAGVTTEFDIEGSPRILNSIVDMGAYEGGVDYPYYIMASTTRITTEAPIGNSPASSFFEIWNLGESNMTYSISNNVNWLSCSPATGASSGEHDVIAIEFSDMSGFALGSYTGQVTIVSAEAHNSPRNIIVVVTIFEPVLDHFEWDTIASPQTENAPINIKITARDKSGYAVPSFTDTADISGLVIGAPVPDIEIGSGTNGWEYPMGTYYHDARTQVIYLNSEIGSACTVTSLTLNVEVVPNLTMNNWTIRMRHTALDSYPASPVWESDWAVVHQSAATISSTGLVTFAFDTPFEYNGTSNLMVDFSLNNTTYGEDGLCLSTDTAVNRSLSYQSDSDDGDPLDWSGASAPTPTMGTQIPNIKLGIVASTPVSITPVITGNFVDGVWLGTITVLETASDVALQASSGEKRGTSNPFNVDVGSTDPDTDGDGIPDWWELKYFGGITNCDTSGHADSDVHDNGQEYIAGTDPTNGASFFGFTNTASVATGFVLQWDPSVSNREYGVSWTNDLSGTFTSLVSGIEFPQNSYTDTLHGTEGAGFYKVEVQLR